jgi:hypothetical protein
MNKATGQAKIDVMARVLNALVQQRGDAADDDRVDQFAETPTLSQHAIANLTTRRCLRSPACRS